MRSFLKGVATTVAALAVIWFGAALADYTILDSTSTTRTVKAFVCETTKICNAHVPVKSDGTEIFTAAAPAQVSLANTAANTNKLLVTPDSVALPANQSVNVAQINAVTPLMGNGVTGTGSPRVTIASDNTPFSVNVSNANANGQATMANSSPVVIASNQSAVPVTLTSTTITGTAAVTQSGTWTTGQTSPYPVTATPYTATATGTTGATTATLAGASSVTTYLCGFSIRANATAAATGNATVTGVITATLNFTQWTAPNASGLGVTEMIFAPCIPASGTNQSVAVVSAAPGTGGVVSVTAWGYKL